MDPKPLTLRELLWMSEGCQEFAWSIASSMMSVIANCHTDGKHTFEPQDFNPFVKEKTPNGVMLDSKESISEMRDAFFNFFGG